MYSKEKKRDYDKQYYNKNKDRLLKKAKDYNQNPENKQKSKEYHKQYYLKNKEKLSIQNKNNYIKHKDSYKEISKSYRINNKEKIVKDRSIYKRKIRYNITQEQYITMLEEQHNCCAACNKPFHGKGGNSLAPAIDHDHKTGKIRGILHQSCNKALGLVDDDIELLDKLIQYLREQK